MCGCVSVVCGDCFDEGYGDVEPAKESGKGRGCQIRKYIG